jgi:hypothetical protein
VDRSSSSTCMRYEGYKVRFKGVVRSRMESFPDRVYQTHGFHSQRYPLGPFRYPSACIIFVQSTLPLLESCSIPRPVEKSTSRPHVSVRQDLASFTGANVGAKDSPVEGWRGSKRNICAGYLASTVARRRSEGGGRRVPFRQGRPKQYSLISTKNFYVYAN